MEVSPVGIADESGHRTIVVALDTEVESLRALEWVQDNFYKTGDIVHMVHVCKCMSSPMEVFHGNPSDHWYPAPTWCACKSRVSAWRNLPSWPAGVPGTSLHVPDPAPHNESSELMSARQFFMGRQAAMLCFHNMLSLHTWS